MKLKALALLLIFVILLACVSCNKSPESSGDVPSEPTSSETCIGQNNAVTQKPSEVVIPETPTPNTPVYNNKYKIRLEIYENQNPAMLDRVERQCKIPVVVLSSCDKCNRKYLPENLSYIEEVEVLGKKYVGTFCDSSCPDHDYEGLRCSYEGELENQKFRFTIDKEKNLLYFRVRNLSAEDESEYLSQDELIGLAKLYYSDITGENLDELGFEVFDIKKYGDECDIKFVLIKEGIWIETVTMELLLNGEFVNFMAYNRMRDRSRDENLCMVEDYEELKSVFDQILKIIIPYISNKSYSASSHISIDLDTDKPLSFRKTVSVNQGFSFFFSIVVEPVIE